MPLISANPVAGSVIHGFPYAMLVRAPLAALVLLSGAMCMPAAEWPGARTGWFWFTLASYLGVMATGLLQLYALPRGIWALWNAPDDSSQLHEVSLLCGALHLGLALLLTWSTSAVY